jgi:cardiolipin synthase
VSLSELPAEWFSWHGLMSAIGLLVYVLGSHALGQRRHPSAAIAWVLMILLLPEIGVPLYLLFGTRKLPRAARRDAVSRAAAAGPGAAARAGAGVADAATAPAARAEPAAVPLWVERLTAAMGLPPARHYRRLAIHDDGRAAREALWRVIESARERLDVCTFILGRDAFGDALLEALARRARAGVRVRLLVDGMGTWMGGRRDFAIASRAGVEVARFAPPLRSPGRGPMRGRTNLRNHRKLVVADGQRLWSGGRNLAGEYFEGDGGRAPWIDLSFELDGDIAAEAAAVFDADWAAAIGPAADPVPALEHRWPAGIAVSAPAAQMLPSGPDYAEDTVHALLLTSFHRARSRILIVTPYLVPDESLLGALTLAARRGVAVDLVLPERSNHRLADIARHRPMRELAAAGARLWLSPGMVHAKAIVIDEHMAMAGSLNLDGRSLFLNFELMTGFYAAADVARFAAWIEALAAGAHAYRPQAPGLARYVGEGLVLWLAFQL